MFTSGRKHENMYFGVLDHANSNLMETITAKHKLMQTFALLQLPVPFYDLLSAHWEVFAC